MDDINNLAKRMAGSRWWYSQSTNPGERTRGFVEISGITADLRTLHVTSPDAVRDLWAKHAPKEMVRPSYLLTPEEHRQNREQMEDTRERLNVVRQQTGASQTRAGHSATIEQRFQNRIEPAKQLSAKNRMKDAFERFRKHRSLIAAATQPEAIAPPWPVDMRY